MELNILTPDRTVFKGEAEKVTVPTRSGYITVLPGHASLVSAVAPGEIRVASKKGDRIFIAERGVIETSGSKASILLRNCREK
jgi:F-type H+-transporting ATPase subunit epsilon